MEQLLIELLWGDGWGSESNLVEQRSIEHVCLARLLPCALARVRLLPGVALSARIRACAARHSFVCAFVPHVASFVVLRGSARARSSIKSCSL